jgi:hypothetical protein
MEIAMKESPRIRIGRYESWIENGALRLQGHEFGRAGGFTACMDALETQKLLALLAQNSGTIEDAAHMDELMHAHTAREPLWSNSVIHPASRS